MQKCYNENTWDPSTLNLFHTDVACYSRNECPLTEYTSSSFGVNVQLKMDAKTQTIEFGSSSTLLLSIDNAVAVELSTLLNAAEVTAEFKSSLLGHDTDFSVTVNDGSWTISYFNWIGKDLPSIVVQDAATSEDIPVVADTDSPPIFMEAIGYKDWYEPPSIPASTTTA